MYKLLIYILLALFLMGFGPFQGFHLDNKTRLGRLLNVSPSAHYLLIDGAGHYLLIDGVSNKLKIDGAS